MPGSATIEGPLDRGVKAIGIPSSGSSIEPLDDLDVADIMGPTFKPRRGPGKNGAALQNRGPLKERATRVKLVGELAVPPGADPVKVADDHLSTLAPIAAKEVEYAMKFGSDTMRYVASRDLLAMKGITTKPKEGGGAPVSMTFMVGSMPVTAAGVPVMPYSNAAKKLAPGVSNVGSTVVDGSVVPSSPQLDAEKVGVTVNTKKGT